MTLRTKLWQLLLRLSNLDDASIRKAEAQYIQQQVRRQGRRL